MFELSAPLGIDPRVDLVFAWLFGDPAHEAFRIDFLNAVLAGDRPRITKATTLNPVHPSSFERERELRVDVEVTDEAGHTYQIEMQRQVRRGLAQRMLYGWARLYAAQLREKPAYHELRSVVGIWLCEEDPFPRSKRAHLRFRVEEVDERSTLHADFRVDVIQLSRVQPVGTGLADADLGRWCRFLNEAASWRTIPPEVYSPVLEAAMKAIDTFRTDTQLNALYQARRNYELERSAELAELEELAQVRAELEAALDTAEAERAAKEAALAAKEAERAAKEAERAAKEAALAAKEAALAELAALRAQLAARGG